MYEAAPYPSPPRPPRLLLPALLALACAPDPPRRDIPSVTWSGTHLDYAPQPHAYALCSGTLPYMDRFVALAADTMQVELDEPLVYVHGSAEDDSFCEDEGVVGCAFRDSVYSLVAPQEHEIVHGVRSFAGFSHLFFEEGTAELFGDDTPMALRKPASGDLLEGMESARPDEHLPTRWYPRAGHFAAYLHGHYGSDVTAAILHNTTPFSRVDEAISTLETATDLPFSTLRADYETQPLCDQPHFRYPVYACDAPEALRARCDGEVALRIEEHIACDDPETLGPRDGQIWKYIAFDIPRDGEYGLVVHSVDEVAGAEVLMKECSLDCDSTLLTLPMRILPPLDQVFLRAGRYAVRLTRPTDAPGSVVLVVSGDDCS